MGKFAQCRQVLSALLSVHSKIMDMVIKAALHMMRSLCKYLTTKCFTMDATVSTNYSAFPGKGVNSILLSSKQNNHT